MLSNAVLASDECSASGSSAGDNVRNGLKCVGDDGSVTDAESAKAGIGEIAKTAIDILFWAIGIIAVIMIIVGGIMYATSMGDPGKAKKAKDAIMYGIVGLVIALLAFAIVRFVTGVLADV